VAGKESSKRKTNRQKPSEKEPGREGRWAKLSAIAAVASVIVAYIAFAYPNHLFPWAAAQTHATPPRATQTPLAQLRAIWCQALTDSAGKEASALGDLKDSITVDDPSSRVTGHTSGYANAYTQVKDQLENVSKSEGRYKSYGGKITTDPYLDDDLNQLPQDLSKLHAAVQDNGIGGQEWNQLTTYRADFQSLLQMVCPV
jgi:hypothetical protein